MEQQQAFSRRQVERSFRKFNDIVLDLFSAHFQTWGDVFIHLMTHCETDPVMKVVTEPLKANTNVNAQQWYADARSSVGGMVGSGRYTLPYDDEDRIALLYQFFLLIETSEVNVRSFCMWMYGATAYQEAVTSFNGELVQKFTREISYRLDEIMSDLGDSQEVPREAMVVFHHHDNSMNIHGNIQGSNVATGGSTISDSTATFTTQEELAGALQSLMPLLQGASEGQRASVDSALKLLIQATGDHSIEREQVNKAADTLVSSAPSIKEKLKDIAGRVGVSLVGSTVFLAIKTALGIK